MGIHEEATEIITTKWIDDIPHEHIVRALGDDHTLIEVEELPTLPAFPVGTRCFFVYSEHPLGIADKICHHISRVYCYNHRYVAINPIKFPPTPDSDIISALTYEWKNEAE
jgi:hypothetical protein